MRDRFNPVLGYNQFRLINELRGKQLLFIIFLMTLEAVEVLTLL